MEQLHPKNDEKKEKLRELEDRPKHGNIRFDGIAKYKKDSWLKTEDTVKDTLTETLGIKYSN